MIPDILKTFDKAMTFINVELPTMQPEIHAGTDGLDRLRHLLERLGDPHLVHRVIHIAGTSGKGTIAYVADALLRTHGFSTGLTVSPYVYDVRERFQINGLFIEEETVLQAVNEMLPHLYEMNMVGVLPSRFETFTALTFSLFARSPLDYVVLETGLGGLMDASNVVTRSDKVAILSSIGLDHTHILGSTLSEIATQKAGILHEGNVGFTFAQSNEVLRAFEQRANTVHAQLNIVQKPRLHLAAGSSLGGVANAQNIELAVSCLEHIASRDGWTFDREQLRTLDDLSLPGRFEKFDYNNKEIILDGAHNPQKVHALVEHVLSMQEDRSWGVILTLHKDSDANSIMQLISQVAEVVIQGLYPEGFDSIKKALSKTEFSTIAKNSGVHYKATFTNQETIEYIKASTISSWLICGSFYNLSEFKKMLMLQ